MIDVRGIRLEDWELVKAVRLAALRDSPEAFAETYAESLARPDGFWRDRAQRSARGESAITFLAFAGDEPAGMAVGLADETGLSAAYLAAVWVAPPFRGTGPAASLVAAVAGWAQSRGAAVLFAGVRRRYSRAEGFYRKIGFDEPVGPVPDHPATRGCGIVLIKKLEPRTGPSRGTGL
ncbi:MAG TPA: GNAT family N-acetyltransferase [bacterium]|nr:GNAT family N-acetyltransferase [bacterium]HPJ71394.1 GNAT family N-acetyltransferase [bacterium]HPQ67196.1 GNAT family N-acetyltransferase [bacterium]